MQHVTTSSGNKCDEALGQDQLDLRFRTGAYVLTARLSEARYPAAPRAAKPSPIIAQVEGSGTGLPLMSSMTTEPLPSPWPPPPAPTARTSPPTKHAGPPSGPHPSGLLFAYDVPPCDAKRVSWSPT